MGTASMSQNFFNSFARHFTTRADKTLLETPKGEQYSYADIDKESAKLANYLSELGVSVGDRVSVQAEKSLQALCLYLACLRGGFIYHPLNPAYTIAELEYFLENAEPTVVICDRDRLSTIDPLIKAYEISHCLTLNADGSGTLINHSLDSSGSFVTAQRDADDVACLLYSSGTTGLPKGIMITHENLSSNAKTLVDVWGFSSNDKLLHALPIFHVHGLFVALGCVLLSGASMHWLAKFNSESVIKYLPESTVLMGVPTYYTRLLESTNFTINVTENVRLFVSGSAPLLEETFLRFQRLTGQAIVERYGMTETNMNCSNPLLGERRAGTVGPALPGVEIRITDDKGSEVDKNEIGNLQVRGPNVFKGYWRLSEKTAEDFTHDGFFNTGDKGRIDSDGYLTIVGRSKDVIISGGLNVYPKEIESVIDDIESVKESAVIGSPDADFGEVVIAVIVLNTRSDSTELATTEKITEHCKLQLANFKVPKKIIFTSELPRNTMGKVQKNLLRSDYIAS